MSDLKDDVEIFELKTNRIRYAIFKILPLIKSLKPDIVFSGWGEISAFLSFFIPFFSKTKFISRETNVVSEHVKRKEILFFYRFYDRYDAIVAQSDDMKNDLINNFGISENKISKINNPVDFDLIDQKLKQKIDLPFDSPTKNVVAIGNLTYRKGFDNLLQVFTFLKNENIKLYILGDGRDRDLLQKQKNELGLENVFFMGNQMNPYLFLEKSDLFILSSRYEGFPNVLLEAGACGTYALANNCPGGIDEIIQEKLNGEIFPIENKEEFANQIKRVLNENHDSEKIRESIFTRFNKQEIIHQYETIFDSL